MSLDSADLELPRCTVPAYTLFFTLVFKVRLRSIRFSKRKKLSV